MVFCNNDTIKINGFFEVSHNPYFNRWFSAIKASDLKLNYNSSHNPYFNRWFSAIRSKLHSRKRNPVTILILIDGFLQ